ncbi:MAG: DUF3822 family protein [Chitinophagales bacterium]
MTLETGNKNHTTTFDAHMSRDCTLLIEWASNDFSYSIYHQNNNRVLLTDALDCFFDLYDWTEQQFLSLIKEQAHFSYSFAATKILIDTSYTTLVPELLFDENKIEELLRFNVSLPSTPLCFAAQKLTSTPYYIIYAYPKNLEKALQSSFNNLSIEVNTYTLLTHLIKQNAKEQYFHLHINMQRIQCSFFKGKELIFHNQFEYNSAEDMLYNILNVYQQIELDAGQCPMHISGVLAKDSETYRMLHEYIRYIHFTEKPTRLNYSNTELPAHYFTTHFAALLQ